MHFDKDKDNDLVYAYYDKNSKFWGLSKLSNIKIVDTEADIKKSSKLERYLLRSELKDALDHTNKELEPYILKESNKQRIALVCDEHFFGNNSGVYTFIKHMVTMFNKMGYVVDLISERNPIGSICQTVKDSDITISYQKNIEYLREITRTEVGPSANPNHSAKVFSKFVGQYLLESYLSKYKPRAIIANSLGSTQCLMDISDTLKSMNIKAVAYTHIGDVLDPTKKSLHDFDDINVKKYLEIFNTSELIIGTQSDKMVGKINTLLDNRSPKDIVHLPEPYFPPDQIETYYDSPEGILIISGNYIRKNYRDMLYYIGKLGLPSTLLCYNPKTQDLDINKEIIKNGITNCRIIPNLYNEYVPSMIKSHRMVLHLSYIEVYPYALLEAIGHVPCVINGASEWGETFLDEAIKIDPSNEEETLSAIKYAYDNYKDIKKLNYKKYERECEGKWKEFLAN